jgi:hypothetical protein
LCAFQQCPVTHDIPDLKLRQTRLPRAKHFTRPAQLEIFLRNDKTVGCLRHDPETLFRYRGLFVTRQQNTVTLFRAASDSPAQLVQLRQPEPFGMFDDHH